MEVEQGNNRFGQITFRFPFLSFQFHLVVWVRLQSFQVEFR